MHGKTYIGEFLGNKLHGYVIRKTPGKRNAYFVCLGGLMVK